MALLTAIAAHTFFTRDLNRVLSNLVPTARFSVRYNQRAKLVTTHDLILHISAPGVALEVVSNAQEHLVSELNQYGPIAEAVLAEGQPGKRGGPIELIGQVGLA